MIGVLVADDHPFVRQALNSILNTAGDIQVVAMAANGEEAIAQAVLHCPNVTIMDISMPVMDGIEATRQVTSLCPETQILMVSTYHIPHYIHRSIEAGASGYILKDAAIRDLITAVRAIYRGDRYFSKQITAIAEDFIHSRTELETENKDQPGFSRTGFLEDA